MIHKTAVKTLFFLACLLLLSPSVSAQKKGKKKGKKTTTQTKMSDSESTILQSVFLEFTEAKMLGDNEKASALLLDCLKIAPKSGTVNYEYALLLDEQKDFEQSIIYAKTAANADPKNKWFQYLYAEMLKRNNDLDGAIQIFERLVENEPENIDHYNQLAYLQSINGNLQAAVETLNRVEKKAGVSEPISYNKQRLFLQMNKVDEAAQEIQNLIDTFPENTEYYNLLAEMYIGNKQPEKASEVYQKLLEFAPNDPNAKLAMAQQYRANGEEEKGIQLLSEAFALPELDPRKKVEIMVNYLTGSAVARTKSAELIKIITDTHPSYPQGFAIQGDILLQLEKPAEALEAYKKSVDLDANMLPVWEQIFFLQSDLNLQEDLAKSSKQAMELFPNQALSYYFNGAAHNRLKNYDKAAKSLKRASLIGSQNEALLAEVYSLLGDTYNSSKNYEKSDASFDKCLKIDPNNAYVLNNYAYFLSLRKARLEKAAEMSKKSNELVPNNPSFLDTYAWILYQQKKFSEAKTWIEKAISNGGDSSATIIEHYGDILLALDDKTGAKAQFQKAIELGGDKVALGKKVK